MMRLQKRLRQLEIAQRVHSPAAPDTPMTDEEFTAWIYKLFSLNVLRFTDNLRIVGGSAFGEDYSGLADWLNEYLADNPEHLPIFPLTLDQAQQALVALDAGHMIIADIRYGDGRLAYRQVSQRWHAPSLDELPSIVDKAIKVLNAQLSEPVALTIESVRELLQMRIEADA